MTYSVATPTAEDVDQSMRNAGFVLLFCWLVLLMLFAALMFIYRKAVRDDIDLKTQINVLKARQQEQEAKSISRQQEDIAFQNHSIQ